MKKSMNKVLILFTKFYPRENVFIMYLTWKKKY